MTVFYKLHVNTTCDDFCGWVPVVFQGDAGKIGEAGSPGPPGQRVAITIQSYNLYLLLGLSSLHHKTNILINTAL